MVRILFSLALSSLLLFVACNDEEENAAPEASNQDFSIAEDATIGSLVGTVVATDPEQDPLSFSIFSGDPDNAFDISDNGEITLQGALNFETTSSYGLTVEIQDTENILQITVTINIEDVDELTIGGREFFLTNGLIEDYGGTPVTDNTTATHYNYDFILSDDVIDAVNGEFSPNANVAVYAELFSLGGTSFRPGVFELATAQEDLDQSFFVAFFVATLDNSGQAERLFLGSSGNITVQENSLNNYTLTFRVTTQEFDIENEELISGSILEVDFTYSGEFDYEDYSGRSGGRSIPKRWNLLQ